MVINLISKSDGRTRDGRTNDQLTVFCHIYTHCTGAAMSGVAQYISLIILNILV